VKYLAAYCGKPLDESWGTDVSALPPRSPRPGEINSTTLILVLSVKIIDNAHAGTWPMGHIYGEWSGRNQVHPSSKTNGGLSWRVGGEDAAESFLAARLALA
jgi:hypothetical protein